MKTIRTVLEWVLSIFIGVVVFWLLVLLASESFFIIVGSVLCASIIGVLVAGITANSKTPWLFGVAAGIIAFIAWFCLSSFLNQYQDLSTFIFMAILSIPYILTTYFLLVIVPKIN